MRGVRSAVWTSPDGPRLNFAKLDALQRKSTTRPKAVDTHTSGCHAHFYREKIGRSAVRVGEQQSIGRRAGLGLRRAAMLATLVSSVVWCGLNVARADDAWPG